MIDHEQKHQLGTKREVIKFAFLPTKLNNGEWIWFKNYRAKQYYDDFEYPAEEVVSEGIMFDTVRCYKETAWCWRTSEKLPLVEIETEETIQKIYK